MTSTKPMGRAISLTTSSVMSVGTFEAFFGQETQTNPAGSSCFRNLASQVSSAARSVAKT
ncbi:MAG TPA: hypothetical protein VHC97_12735 [Thermoanaerobaculia bacterium]|nr:hypothetical protein [Thermoanaerobaculia bacterium]